VHSERGKASRVERAIAAKLEAAADRSKPNAINVLKKGSWIMANSQMKLVLMGLAAAALFAGAPLAGAQSITSEQAKQMLDELKQIRQLLEKQQQGMGNAAAPPDDKVNVTFVAGKNTLGKADAPLTLVEFTDYQCPFCQQFHNGAYPQIKANFIDTGKVRYVSKDFPLDFHAHAKRAAVAARCAGEQNKFWEFRHILIVNADQLDGEKIYNHAKTANVDVPKLRACVDSNKYAKDVEKDMAEGMSAGVNGTPSFVLGRVEKDKLIGVRLVGAMPYNQFEAKINEFLEQKAAAK